MLNKYGPGVCVRYTPGPYSNDFLCVLCVSAVKMVFMDEH
jgi:hypothetical protein